MRLKRKKQLDKNRFTFKQQASITMKKFIFSMLLCLSINSITTSSQAQAEANSTIERYVTCEVVQSKTNAISIIPNKNYLKGTDYWKNVLYNTDGTKRTFVEANEAISYLGGYGWKNVRQYTNAKDKSIHFVMQKQCSAMELNGSNNAKQWFEIISGKKQK